MMFVANMFGVDIVDISNPAIPQNIGRVRTPGIALRLVVDSSYVYVAERFGLTVIDYRTPTSPVLRSFSPIAGTAYDIVVHNNIAFLSTLSRIFAYDVSNPGSPIYLSNLYVDTTNLGIHITKHPSLPLLYCAANSSQRRLFTVDISNPSAMQTVATATLPAGGTVWSPPMITGNMLYVAETIGLDAFSLANPSQPSLVYSQLPAGSQSMYSATVQDTFYFHTHWQRGWWVSSIADPTTPRVLRSYQAPDTFGIGYGIATVQGRYLYLANSGRTNIDKGWSVRIIDILNPMNATVVGIAQSPTEGYTTAHHVLTRNNRTYALVVQDNSKQNYSGSWTYGGLLRILDVTDPRTPQLLATTDFTGMPYAVVAKDSVAIVRANWPSVLPDYEHRLYVYSIADLSNPVLTQQWGSTYPPVGTTPVSVTIHENRVYGLFRQTLNIFSINPDQTLTLLGSAGVPNANPLMAIRVRRVGGTLFAYVAGGGGASTGGFLILNVTNPAGVFLWSAFDTQGIAWDIVLQGNYAFLSDGPTGAVWVFDISNNAAQPVTSTTINGSAQHLAIANNLLYVLNSQGSFNANVEIIDVSNQTAPVDKGTYLNRLTKYLSVSDDGRQLYLSSNYSFDIRRSLFNYRPLPFALVAPADSSTVSDTVRFIWRRSEDANDDTLIYRLHIWRSDVDTTFTIRSDTSYFWNAVTMPQGWYRWSVTASDAEFQVASLDTFAFRLLTTGVVDNEGLPVEFSLYQNYPNPFNPATRVRFALPVQSKVRAEIYNLLGQHVTTLVNNVLPAGYHSVDWNGRDDRGRLVGSGIYLLRLSASGTNGLQFVDVKKLMLLK